MTGLRIYLLGEFMVKQDEKLVALPRKTAALLAYLVCEKRPFSREHLADLFWYESTPKQGAANLRKHLSRLREILGDALFVDRQTVCFNTQSSHWLDTDAFTQILDSCSPDEQTAIALYRDNFLTGLHLDDSPGFDAWAVMQREQYQRLATGVLQSLVRDQLHQRQYQQGLHYVDRLLLISPLNEQAQRQKMLLFARSNQLALAQAQYETFCHRLLTDLGCEPSYETKMLAKRIQVRDSYSADAPIVESSFIGRTVELTQINRQLAEPTCRLLTLAGPGGVGKTRLAYQTAADQDFNFLHGVFFISLIAVTSKSVLVATMARALQISFSGSDPADQQLLNYIRQKEMLLVLDNCEVLLADGMEESLDFILAMLTQANQVKILATSRERFNFPTEYVLTIGGMDTSDSGQSESLQLFQARAKLADPNFALTSANQSLVLELCQLLEGLPLGIELATVALAQYPLDEIIIALNRSLDFLTLDQADIPDRHLSLRAVFNSTWQQLSLAEQETVKRLSVLSGTFTLETAVFIAQTIPQQLLSLVDKSMLQLTQPGRYQMHNVLRQYAFERLTPAERADVQTRHSHHFLRFLSEKTSDLMGTNQQETLTAINHEIDQVRIAWEWATSNRNISQLGRALKSLYQFYSIRGWYQEGNDLFEATATTLATSNITSLSDEEAHLLGRLWACQGKCCELIDALDQAAQLCEQSRTLLSRLNACEALAMPLHGLGMIAHMRGAYETAEKYLQESLMICQETEDNIGVANALNGLCLVAKRQGKYELSKDRCLTALKLRRQLGSLRGIASSLNSLGLIECKLAHYEAAHSALTEGLAICQQIEFKVGQANVLSALCQTNFYLDDLMGARQCIEKSLTLYRDIGDEWGEAIALNNLGYLASETGDYASAKPHFETAIVVYQRIGVKSGLANTWCNLGDVCRHLGQEIEAQRCYDDGLRLAQEIQALPTMLKIMGSYAALLADQAQIIPALKLLAVIKDHPANRGAVQEQATALFAKLSETQPDDEITAGLSTPTTFEEIVSFLNSDCTSKWLE